MASWTDSKIMTNEGPYCQRCAQPLIQGAVATEQRACCLNATPIVGICPTHGPLGPHHVVESGSDHE